MALRTISLCSGIGGLDIGLDEGARRAGLGGARAVCMVEGEAFAAATLVAAMERGDLAPAPIWSDVRTFDAVPWSGVVDCVVAGYPCQPFSVAGHRKGGDDERHIWPDVARIIRECGPALCFLENVTGHLSLGGHEVIGDLQEMGYRVAATLRSARGIGAPHRRNRLFVMGIRRVHAIGCDLDDDCSCFVADSDDYRREGLEEIYGAHGCVDFDRGRHADGLGLGNAWSRRAPEPDLRRVDDGDAARLDRLRALGNAVVPEQAACAFVELWNAMKGDAS